MERKLQKPTRGDDHSLCTYQNKDAEGCYEHRMGGALNEFSINRKCASRVCSMSVLGTGKDQPISALRGLFGAFLVYARMENLEKVQSLVKPLSALIHECADCECTSHYESPFVAHPCSSSREQERTDCPLLGPDRISIEECQDHVEQTADALRRMLWQVKQETIRSLATAMINRLASTAIRCCRAGNAWKGCLQRLTNKYHYWKLLGVPSQTGYYREED